MRFHIVPKINPVPRQSVATPICLKRVAIERKWLKRAGFYVCREIVSDIEGAKVEYMGGN